jgi:sterol desaturase/sphingolipid hydroxylase (fatty acid hydroxylase superfamily)
MHNLVSADLLHALTFILVAGLFFIVVMAGEAWYWHRKGRTDAYELKDTLSNMTMGFSYKVIDGIITALVGSAVFGLLQPLGLRWHVPHGPLGWVIAFVLTDFIYYLAHFCWHKVRWFWTGHAVHHSSQRMNYSTALRQNYVLVLNGGSLLIGSTLALIGFDKTLVIVIVEINLFYQFFLHTEAPSFLDRLGWILNTPSHHRVHHGSNPLQIDTNFAGALIIWDKLFGTFRHERDVGPIVYGVTERQPVSFNPLYLQWHEFGTMLRDAWRHKDPRVLIRHPGWVENTYGRAAKQR